MGISVISLFANNPTIENLVVYLIVEGISQENRVLLKDISKEYGREIVVIDAPEITVPESLIKGRWPLSAFIRLYAGLLLPESIDRILYLDCDTIVVGDMSEIERINIENNTIWGVKDCVGKRYKNNIGMPENAEYINAGVLLLNLRRLRNYDINAILERFMDCYRCSINYADQDVLNGCFYKDFGILPAQYDVMTIVSVYPFKEILRLRRPTNYYLEEDINYAKENPIIIHYTTNMMTIRPWFANSDHPLKEEFRKYLSMSPWKDRELTNMDFSSGESFVIKIVSFLPTSISLRVLGWLHSTAKPIYIRIKNYITKGK